MKFSDYKDANDFLQKSGLDSDSAITFLDAELKKLNKKEKKESEENGHQKRSTKTF